MASVDRQGEYINQRGKWVIKPGWLGSIYFSQSLAPFIGKPFEVTHQVLLRFQPLQVRIRRNLHPRPRPSFSKGFDYCCVE
jgi:hypothetical protein